MCSVTKQKFLTILFVCDVQMIRIFVCNREYLDCVLPQRMTVFVGTVMLEGSQLDK